MREDFRDFTIDTRKTALIDQFLRKSCVRYYIGAHNLDVVIRIVKHHILPIKFNPEKFHGVFSDLSSSSLISNPWRRNTLLYCPISATSHKLIYPDNGVLAELRLSTGSMNQIFEIELDRLSELEDLLSALGQK